MAALTLDWQSDGPSRATIREGGATLGIARLLGLPFLAAGGYFLYQFLGGLFSGGLLLGGWILLPLFAAVFLIPGWILVFGRRRTLIDNTRREIVQEMDYLVYTRRIVSRVTSDSSVMLRYEASSTDRNRVDIHVYVDNGNEQRAMIGLFTDRQKTEALAFAAKAAAFLTIPLKDRLVEKGDINSAGVVVEQLDPEDED